MQVQVSLDALTHLNNRGQINRYMEQVRQKENTVTWTMMIDIDGFKEINDTYGHAEGDRALILVAETLKQVSEQIRTPVFIGRYGGDEFTAFLQAPVGENLPEKTAEAIREALDAKEQEMRLPYDLEVSVGYDALGPGNDTMEASL